MIKKRTKKLSLGFTLIEVLVACSIISIAMFALMQTAEKGVRLSSEALNRSQASLLLEEGAESIKSIRDNSWATITALNLNTPYHLFFNTSTKVWGLNTSTTDLSGCIPTYPIDGLYNRTITINSVGRDANDVILASGGVIDPGTKKVTVTVTWNSHGSIISKSLYLYITDIFD